MFVLDDSGKRLVNLDHISSAGVTEPDGVEDKWEIRAYLNVHNQPRTTQYTKHYCILSKHDTEEGAMNTLSEYGTIFNTMQLGQSIGGNSD